MHIDCRGNIEPGLYDVVGTIDERITDDLNITRSLAGDLSNEGSDILIDIGCEDRLDHEYVIASLNGL